MSKSTKANAIFLATVLVAGIIALSYPSILVGAQAEEYVMDQRYDSYKPEYGMNSYDEKQSYGKDSNSYDKSKDSSVSVKKIKCNNINVNINGFNGLEIGTVPPALNGLTTEALGSDEGEVGANSLGSGVGSNGKSSGNDGDSRFICINNNDFNVGDGGGGTPTDPTCEECFADISAELRTAIEDVLAAGPITIPGTDIVIDAGTIVELCEFLDLNPLSLTREQIELAIDAFIGTNTGLEAEVRALIECLIDAGVIIVIPPDGDDACGDCFAALTADLQIAINDLLDNPGPISVPGIVTIPADVETIAELCVFLNENPITVGTIGLNLLITLFANVPGSSTAIATVLINCLVDADVIIVGT